LAQASINPKNWDRWMADSALQELWQKDVFFFMPLIGDAGLRSYNAPKTNLVFSSWAAADGSH
jgi:hypothetical protein